ncbi:MAG: transporter substrate-binding domain-containing protein [Phormidesmis sp. CAN_BIN36]|nr:transporter substrate-binding domain-containing protein [Phormidesmis sp. CAN_BIN36]
MELPAVSTNRNLQQVFARGIGLYLLGVQFTAPLYSWAADLKTIVQRGQMIVAVKDNLHPLGFRDANGTLQGLEIDIAQRLSQELLGKPSSVVFKPVNNQDRLAVVIKGEVDMTIARVTATPSRSRVVSFSIPYYLDRTALVTNTSAIQGISDLTNRTIAVLNDSSTISTLRYRLPQTKLIGVNSYTEGKALLASGKVAAFAADTSVLSSWVKEFPTDRLLPLRLSTESLCIVLPKGVQYDDLRRQINQALDRWKAEGWLRQRAIYWGLL